MIIVVIGAVLGAAGWYEYVLPFLQEDFGPDYTSSDKILRWFGYLITLGTCIGVGGAIGVAASSRVGNMLLQEMEETTFKLGQIRKVETTTLMPVTADKSTFFMPLKANGYIFNYYSSGQWITKSVDHTFQFVPSNSVEGKYVIRRYRFRKKWYKLFASRRPDEHILQGKFI